LGFFGSIGEGLTNIFQSAQNKKNKVNDAIITPKGDVIKTNPSDYLIATKTPQELAGGGKGTINVNINGGMYLDRNAGQKLAEVISQSLRTKVRV